MILRPGDVIATRNPRGWSGVLRRLAAAMHDRPNTVDHIIIVHHEDPQGLLWGIEARPGGVGDRALTPTFLSQPYLLSNAEQPKTEEQRFLVAKAAERLRGAAYDWEGIAIQGARALGINLWDREWGPEPPAHIYCSTYADWAYEEVGLASPLPDTVCAPWDWAAWMWEKAWQSWQ